VAREGRPSGLPTDVRAVVRVLLRGLPSTQQSERLVEGYTVLVMGDEPSGRWPVKVHPGDVEGVVWTTHSQVPRVIRALRENACVVWAAAG
jgi:hypothetical protein